MNRELIITLSKSSKTNFSFSGEGLKVKSSPEVDTPPQSLN